MSATIGRVVASAHWRLAVVGRRCVCNVARDVDVNADKEVINNSDDDDNDDTDDDNTNDDNDDDGGGVIDCEVDFDGVKFQQQSGQTSARTDN